MWIEDKCDFVCSDGVEGKITSVAIENTEDVNFIVNNVSFENVGVFHGHTPTYKGNEREEME